MAMSTTLLGCTALLLAMTSAACALQLPTVIDSNMVLPREPLFARVWGFGSHGERITITIDGGHQWGPLDVGADGRWSIDLGVFPESTGRTLTFSNGSFTRTLTNIAFGDVFLCSGQSNMEFSVNDAFNASAEIADSINYPNLRLFTVAKAVADEPQYDCTSKSNYTWAVSAPSAFVGVGGAAFSWFSATCYFFGRDVYRALGGKVPIGLVASDWGGQRVEAFSSPDALNDTTCGGTVPSGKAAAALYKQRKSTWAPVASSGPAPNPGPTQLWNAMIYPLLNMRFAGATWYQGEANAGDPPSYACRFPAMIADWRKKMGIPLPFYFVQLAAFSSDYALIREAQLAALKLPMVDFATAIDIGDPTSPEGSIHPRRKQEVGRRLSLVALTMQYDRHQQCHGPVLTGHTLHYDNATGMGSAKLTFDNTNNLHSHGTAACKACCSESPFELGNGAYFVRANFTIVEGGVELSANMQGIEPLMVRYDFEGYPQCAIYNGEGGPDDHAGLPAYPFRTAAPPPLNYTLVFRQTFPYMYKPGQWSVNATDPTSDNYSILDKLESFRTKAGRLNFRLTWPLDIGMQHWKQSSNPVTTPKNQVKGYQAISTVSTNNFWGGLGQSLHALLDGSQNNANPEIWYYAVGSSEVWNGGIPAYGNDGAQSVVLQARGKDGQWHTVLRQTMPYVFKTGELNLNSDQPDADNFAILDQLESFRGSDGLFELRMFWPDMGNEWSQTSNPVTTTSGAVEGYLPRLVRHTGSAWCGLHFNTNQQSLLDGSCDHEWFYAIGDFGTVPWGKEGIPGPGTPQQMVELYVEHEH
eukprot:m.121236 g.121236  ORF g.121236 m.121236 type:complete len:810 (+) comp9600_c0_seq5:87-2516(+)